MSVTEDNVLSYINNWESDQYFVGNKMVAELHKVKINGETYDVKSHQISVPYSDMGHTYTATSKHFFIDVEVCGVTTTIDLNRLVKKTKIYVIDAEYYNEVK